MTAARNPLLYNTNGFAFHRLDDAVRILAGLGYDGVALTPDVHHLDPLRATPAEVAALRDLLAEHRLCVVVETGARFVLDPARKHRPTLLDEPREASVRLDFLRRCADLGAALGATVISTWSGAAPPGLAEGAMLERLAHGLRALCEHAGALGLRVGFEPEPGMAVETAHAWPRVRDAVDHPALGLTLDVGHCVATREGDPGDVLARHARDLVVVQVDDHRGGRHEHLMFGDGEVPWTSVATALAASGYAGPIEVELSRHAAEAPSAAARSLAFLKELLARP